MSEMFQEFEFSISAFGKNRRRKRLHDLLDRDGGAGELVLGGAFDVGNEEDGHGGREGEKSSPDKTERAWEGAGSVRKGIAEDRTKDSPIPTGWRST